MRPHFDYEKECKVRLSIVKAARQLRLQEI